MTRPAADTNTEIFLRRPQEHHISIHPPDRQPFGDDPLADGGIASVYIGDSRIWARDPEAFRALAIALTQAADELDDARERYNARRADEPGAVGV